MKSLKDLNIYNLAYELAIQVHAMSLTLPSYEMFEQGSQIGRSSKSIKDNIAEGYGRRRFKGEFIRFLTISYASLLECQSQLDMIYSIHKKDEALKLKKSYDTLGTKIYTFIRYVETHWKE